MLHGEASEAVEILVRRGLWDLVAELATAMDEMEKARSVYAATSAHSPDITSAYRAKIDTEARAQVLIDAVI